MVRHRPRSRLTDTLFPSTTRFRSGTGAQFDPVGLAARPCLATLPGSHATLGASPRARHAYSVLCADDWCAPAGLGGGICRRGATSSPLWRCAGTELAGAPIARPFGDTREHSQAHGQVDLSDT